MNAIRRSWTLAKASYAVLRADRELLLLPLLSFLALTVIVIAFALPLVLFGLTPDGEPNAGGIVLAFVFYVVAYSVAFFFNTALVGSALIRLEGGDPTLRDGLRIATARLPVIVGYAVVAATVGMILRAIAERAGVLGQIVGGLLGFAWSVATFLVVPILVAENVGPLEAIRRSGSLLRKTWGEQLLGNAGISLVFGLLAVVTVVVGAAVIVILASVSTVLAIVGVALVVLAVGGIALVGAALSGIFTASVYRYATTGQAGDFGSDVLQAAFRRKGG